MEKILNQLPASHCAWNIDSQSGNLFLLLLNTLFASQCALKNPNLYPPDSAAKIQDGEHFDFIVIGAGSAGSVVGSRLANTGKWKVLLVEAGGFPSITTEIPGLVSNNQLITNQTWNYYTEPSEKSCNGFKNRACYWPRGKVLGGCSSINAMLYVRGNRKDYDSWAQNGNEGWDYENIKQYFKRSEKLLAPNLEQSNTYGREGSIPLTKYKNNDTVGGALFQSAEQLGYKILDKEAPLGFFESLMTIENGVRYNTAKILVSSTKNNDKLTLVINAHVEKIIMDKGTKKAEGIKVKIGAKTFNIYADKEVILSAGAINSPQILMLSGVGPGEHLRQEGIEVIQELRVGENLQDHLFLPIFSKLSDDAMESTELLGDIFEYFAYKQGALSHLGHLNTLGFINTKNDSIYPDIQFHYITFPKSKLMVLKTFLESIGIDQNISEQLRIFNRKNNILLTFITLLQPKSVGKISLKNTDPLSHPRIHSGYMSDENGEDMETTLRGVRIAEAQLQTKAFKELNVQVLDIGIPNCKHFEFDTDDYWRCAMRNIATTLYHPTSTCKMGPKSDTRAVVDSRLKVHGVKNLRVVDASVMPNIVSGNTHAASMMIGQKGAQMIIEDHVTEKEEL